MTDTREIILNVLKKAYQIEVEGHAFYSMVADRADKPAVQDLFAKLAQDEVEHKAYLREISRNYEKSGTSAFSIHRRDPDFAALRDQIFSTEFRKQAEGASFEFSVLSIGMQLESRAIAHFSQAAKAATDSEVKAFYQFLADWERGHLDALKDIYEGVRSDFWAEGGFSPF